MVRPAWIDTAVIYSILPDRFARGSRPRGLDSDAWLPWEQPGQPRSFLGGMLDGIESRLPYLADLGITILYLLPVWPSPSYHGYKPTDWFSVEPRLGGNAAFDRLLSAAHDRGMKLILDVVYNHVSWAHPAFANVWENGQHSPYRSWFQLTAATVSPMSPDPGYACWAGRHDMPELNHTSPAVQDEIIHSLAFWTARGVDGFRLDCPTSIGDVSFWHRARETVHAINPDVVLIGEVWSDAHEWLTTGAWDGVTDYPRLHAIRRFAGQGHNNPAHILPGSNETFPLNGRAFAEEIDRQLARYPIDATFTNWSFINSLDLARYVTVCGSAERAWLATVLAFTLPGTPCIVYGDEVGMPGSNDPENRDGFPLHPNTGSDSWQRMHDLIALRRRSRPLQVGSLHWLEASDTVIVFERRTESHHVAICANAGDIPQTVVVRQTSVVIPERSVVILEGENV